MIRKAIFLVYVAISSLFFAGKCIFFSSFLLYLFYNVPLCRYFQHCSSIVNTVLQINSYLNTYVKDRDFFLNIFWFHYIRWQATLLLPPVPWELKVSVLLFNLRDSRPAKLTTPLNKVKRLLQRCLDSPLMYGENIRPPPPANCSPQPPTKCLFRLGME